MSTPLGRVLSDDDLRGPRGPDGRHRIVVPAAWLSDGCWVEIELPRAVSCACCEGGGCDACGRSGAVDTRARDDEPERIALQLPVTGAGATLRLPRRGGVAGEAGAALGRGVLLLTISPGGEASEGVRRRESSLAAAPRPEEGSRATLASLPQRSSLWGAVFLVALVIGALLLLVFLAR